MNCRVALIVLLAALAGACSGPSETEVPAPDGDSDLFEQLEPVLRARCGFLGCHGREGVPLTLYTLDYLRLRDPEGGVDSRRPTLNERALSEGEVEHNRRAIAARAGQDNGSTFILRLVALDQGGISHADTVVYDRLDHPELDLFRRFFESVNAH